jgi:hypothetical protein|tara:strand:- start:3961 stop:4209 length:249 start_codon:yes stop_codon:yes gene_type:complete
MIDKKISIGSLITIGTIIVSAGIAYGVSSNKIENVEEKTQNNVKSIKKNTEDITNLKIGVAKIETQLDNRFDRLEEILMDLE